MKEVTELAGMGGQDTGGVPVGGCGCAEALGAGALQGRVAVGQGPRPPG